MERPIRFEDFRYVGDKRSQIVYDLDNTFLEKSVIDELMESEQFICFGPDSLDEAKNRCYRPDWTIREAEREAAAAEY